MLKIAILFPPFLSPGVRGDGPEQAGPDCGPEGHPGPV